MFRPPFPATVTMMIAALSITFAGCEKPERPQLQPLSVTTMQPFEREFRGSETYVGVARSHERVEVRARVTGILERPEEMVEPEPEAVSPDDGSDTTPEGETTEGTGVGVTKPHSAFKEGEKVAAGAVLFRIEPEKYQADVDSAIAAVDNAQAQADVSQAEFDRVKNLFEKKVSTQSEFDLAKAQLEVAKASVKTAQAAKKQAELQLSYTTVKAPISGVIGEQLIDFGNLVGSGDNSLLTTIEGINPIYAYFEISETRLQQFLDFRAQQIAAGNTEPQSPPVSLSTDDGDTFTFKGELDFLNNTIDENTGTAMVRAIFKNEPEVVFPGRTVRIRIDARETTKVLMIPEESIGIDLKGHFVLIVEQNDENEDVAKRQYIEIGDLTDDGHRIVLNGLTADSHVIFKGQQAARPGLPVLWPKENQLTADAYLKLAAEETPQD